MRGNYEVTHVNGILVEQLTPREKQAAILAAVGLTNKEVAETLHISEGTVKQYLHKVCEKGYGTRSDGGITKVIIST